MECLSLHIETAYSFKGSDLTVESLVKKAKELGYTRVVLTDAKMHAAYKFYQVAKREGLKTIFGLSLNLEPLFDGDKITVNAYAQSMKGYKNLLKLSSLQSFNDALPLLMIKKYTDDVSLVINPLVGEVNMLLKRSDDKALQQLMHEVSLLSDNVFLGVHHSFDEVNSHLQQLPFDAVYYSEDASKDTRKVLRQIFQLDEEISDEHAFKDQTYFSAHYSDKLCGALDQFLTQHELVLEYERPSLPHYKTPKKVKSSDYLNALSYKGLERRIAGKQLDLDVYKKRLDSELEVIHTLGYDDYFLIVYDVIKYARKENILVGPGRGSAPGSLVAYCLGITSVDPIEYGLVFERFLNPARKNLPDIDTDFPDHSRDKVIEYTRERYGKEYVANLATFGTFLSKSSLRDTARVLNIESKYIDEMARKIASFDSVNDMINDDADVQNRMKHNDELAHWLKCAASVEGLPRHVSTHAAGIMLSEEPLIHYTAIQEGLGGLYQTQFEQTDLEAIGLLKMDYLGLRNLTLIEMILARILDKEGKVIDLYKIPLDDQTTHNLLREKSTTGIFQLESEGMRNLIKRMKMQSFDDIVTVLALYRPGPMEQIPVYLKRRHKQESIEPLAKEVDPILADTEGILLYQEQIMAIASHFAGYTMSEADILRRAVSKKDASLLEEERKNFVTRAKRQNKDERLAHKIYDFIVKFANYGFNKSHSVAYGLVSYWMAYLKANYPAHFIGVLMQQALGNERLMHEYQQEAFSLGLEVVRPDINISTREFVLKNNRLYYPLQGIKNVGKSTVVKVLEERDQKAFTSFADFVKRMKGELTKRMVHYLIYAGALDTFKLSKKTMIDNYDALENFVSYEGSIDASEFVYQKSTEFTQELLKRYEKDALGFNLAYDPLKAYDKFISDNKCVVPSKVNNKFLNQSVKLIGSVASIREIKTKKGDLMAFVTLEDRTKSIESVCFPNRYISLKDTLEEGQVYLFFGRVENRNETLQYVIETVTLIKP